MIESGTSAGLLAWWSGRVSPGLIVVCVLPVLVVANAVQRLWKIGDD